MMIIINKKIVMLIICKFVLLILILITPNTNKINNKIILECIINNLDKCHNSNNYSYYIYTIKNKCIQNNYIKTFI